VRGLVNDGMTEELRLFRKCVEASCIASRPDVIDCLQSLKVVLIERNPSIIVYCDDPM